MPSPLSPGASASDGRTRAVIAVVAVACACVGVLAVLGGAEAWAAALAAAAIALTGVAALRAFRDPAPADDRAAEPPGREHAPPLTAALDALPDPFVVVEGGEIDDFAGRRIVFANQAARALWRIDGEGALLVSAVRRPEVLEAVDESLYGRIPRMVSFDAGGAQDRAFRVSTLPLSDAGAPLAAEGEAQRRYALLLLRDETDSRRAERMRVDFLANASHELRTPLASLAGFVETLRGHAKDDAVARQRFLAIMAAQAERMSRLVDDLLSLSRVELNEHVPPAGRCDLGLAATDVADALQPLSAAQGVALELKLPCRGASVVVGDRDQLVQVAQNLVDNALKYSAPGSMVTVEVAGDLDSEEAAAPDPHGPASRREARLAGGGRVALLTPDRTEGQRFARLRVTDHGPGMTREHLPRLTERFYRVEGQKSGERAGTGLGLAIVKHIVNRHRGGLSVESAPGEGAAFTVWLPMAEAAAAERSTSTPLPASPYLVTKAS